MYVRMYVFTVCMYVCMYLCVYIYMYVCMSDNMIVGGMRYLLIKGDRVVGDNELLIIRHLHVCVGGEVDHEKWVPLPILLDLPHD
jgi:hypothetical protein